MSRTYKDQKPNKVALAGKLKKPTEPLNQKYVNYKLTGYAEEHENLDGDCCPKCGAPTDFQDCYLICNNCGWVDTEITALDGLAV